MLYFQATSPEHPVLPSEAQPLKEDDELPKFEDPASAQAQQEGSATASSQQQAQETSPSSTTTTTTSTTATGSSSTESTGSSDPGFSTPPESAEPQVPSPILDAASHQTSTESLARLGGGGAASEASTSMPDLMSHLLSQKNQQSLVAALAEELQARELDEEHQPSEVGLNAEAEQEPNPGCTTSQREITESTQEFQPDEASSQEEFFSDSLGVVDSFSSALTINGSDTQMDQESFPLQNSSQSAPALVSSCDDTADQVEEEGLLGHGLSTDATAVLEPTAQPDQLQILVKAEEEPQPPIEGVVQLDPAILQAQVLEPSDEATVTPPEYTTCNDTLQQSQPHKQQMPAPIQYHPFPADHCPSVEVFGPPGSCPSSPVIILESACPTPPLRPTAIFQPSVQHVQSQMEQQVPYGLPGLPLAGTTDNMGAMYPVGQSDQFAMWPNNVQPAVYSVSSVESLPMYPPMVMPNFSTAVDPNNNVFYSESLNSGCGLFPQSQIPMAANTMIQYPDQELPNGVPQQTQDLSQTLPQHQDPLLQQEQQQPETNAGPPPPAHNPVVYPMIYVSPAGLLTVLLQHEVAVEMTMDRTIRVVNHRHKSVAATSSRGNASCIYHSGAKIYQYDTTTEVDVFWDRRAKMTPDSIEFAFGSAAFELVAAGLKIAEPHFMDLSKDTSVSLLFSASGYGPHLVKQYEEMTEKSRYKYLNDGGLVVYINGAKIHQSAHGDVTVTAGRKRIRVSPVYGSLYIDTHFVEMAVEMNWNIKVRRGSHRLHASFAGFILCDGRKECGFDAYRQVFCQPMRVQMHTIIWNEYPEEFESAAYWRPYWENAPYRTNSRRRYPSRRYSSTYTVRNQASRKLSSERIRPVQRVRSRSSERVPISSERFRNTERTQSATNCWVVLSGVNKF